MKRFFNTSMVAMLISSVFLTSCGGLATTSEDSDELKNVAYSADFGKYSEVGKNVIAYFEETYSSDEESRRIYLDADSNYESYILADDTSTVDFLLNNGYISRNAAEYIEQFEKAIQNNEDASVAMEAITATEKMAIEKLSASDLDVVMNYAEVAKATIAYFSALEDDNVARFSLKKLKRWGKAAASAALGATVGGIIGNGIGNVTVPVIGTISGTVAGAVIGGTASAINGYKNDAICIFIPLSSITNS